MVPTWFCCAITPHHSPFSTPGGCPTHSGAPGPEVTPFGCADIHLDPGTSSGPAPSVPLSHPAHICTRGCDLPCPDPGLMEQRDRMISCDKIQCAVTLQGWMSQPGQAAPTPLSWASSRTGTALACRAVWHCSSCPGGHTSCRTSCASFCGQGLHQSPATALHSSAAPAPGQLLSRDQVCLSQAKCILYSDRLRDLLSSSCPNTRLSCKVSEFFFPPSTLPRTTWLQPEPTFLAQIWQNKFNWKIIH